MGFKAECTPLPDTTFEWGRTDCPTAPKQPEEFEFPKVEMTRTQMLDFFTKEFGFNAQEVSDTALIVTHFPHTPLEGYLQFLKCDGKNEHAPHIKLRFV